MLDVTIQYSWISSLIPSTDPLVVGLGNVTVPAGGSGAITFPPIASDAVNSNPAIEGATATLTMTFRARTVDGAEIVQVATRQLIVEICT